MQRRHLLISLAVAPVAAHAHHGWSGFDQDRPLFLQGTARKVAWRNPHAELDLELPADLTLPADLAKRTVPAQSASVDGPRLLAGARLPTRKDRIWHIELAPLTRLEAWKVAAIKDGDRVEVLGYTTSGEKGDPVLRAEYLFVDGRAYGLRSSPA
jgi:Family of unknown function (DUF6152)